MFKSYKTRENYSAFPLLIAQSYSIEKHILRKLELINLINNNSSFLIAVIISHSVYINSLD